MTFQPITPEECAEKLSKAGSIAVLTGAGMSTAAGVPDFRGPKGLYVTRQYDPETVFEIGYFDRRPEPFYQFSRDFLSLLGSLKPTYTHRFLARLEEKLGNVTLATQNIDGLHQRAGSKNVLPVHGDYETAHCRKCGRRYNGAELAERMEKMPVPLCDACKGVIKPDVVFFGENVRHLEEADAACRNSDILLVLGSSLTVYPVAMLPAGAGGDVVIVNQGPVGMSPGPRVFLADCGLDDFFVGVAEGMGIVVE